MPKGPTNPDPGNTDAAVYPFKYRYNGKEYQDEMALNLYDYGARNYDPAIGRWMNVDGMSEKYFSNSPYHYADNNPILNYDVDGNYFSNTFSLITALTYQQHLRERIAANNTSLTDIDKMLLQGGQSKEAITMLNNLKNTLKKSNAEFQTSIGEVSTLMASNQAYAIENAGAFASFGQASYDKVSRSVNIKAPLGNGFALLGHELKHAYQFDKGIEGLAYMGAKNLRVIDFIGIDLADEWNAYKIQNSIEPGTGYNSYNELHNDMVGPYSKHPRNPSVVSDHAEIQKILKSNGSDSDKSRWLNNLSNRTRIAFRINETTYDGNN